jgi:Tol biopolymer transport system component
MRRTTRILVVDDMAAEARRLARARRDAGYAPDGNTTLFDDLKSLYVVHPDASGMTKIPLVTHSFSRLQGPDWSPDGAKIVVSLLTATRPGTGQAGIYTANADGSDVQRATSSPTFDATPDWGPHPLAT